MEMLELMRSRRGPRAAIYVAVLAAVLPRGAIAEPAERLGVWNPPVSHEASASEKHMSLFKENAEILNGMKDKGVDVHTSRIMEFNHLFPNREMAASFAISATKAGFDAKTDEYPSDDYPWDVTVSKEMVPSAENVTEAEERLGDLAQKFEGYADGWGFVGT